MSSQCVTCQGNLVVENEIICDFCRGSVHTTCSGLSRLEVQCFRNKARKLTFHCSSCSDFKLQLTKMHELASIVNTLRDDIRVLKLQSTTASIEGTVDPLTTENIISEIAEREKRKNNIIIFNLPELESGGRDEQLASDKESIQTILGTLNIPSDGVTSTRLGKFDPTQRIRKRPLKLKLRNHDEVISVLRDTKKIKEIEKFKSVSLSKDRTPLQTSFYNNLKRQLKERLDAGEQDLYIRHFNDVPKIVKRKASGN